MISLDTQKSISTSCFCTAAISSKIFLVNQPLSSRSQAVLAIVSTCADKIALNARVLVFLAPFSPQKNACSRFTQSDLVSNSHSQTTLFASKITPKTAKLVASHPLFYLYLISKDCEPATVLFCIIS
jgi:hypothetical protein